MASLVSKYDLVKQNYLNILVLQNIIPSTLKKIQQNDHKALNKKQSYSHELSHYLTKFQNILNNIIQNNTQQQLKNTLQCYLQFNQALKTLKTKLTHHSSQSNKNIKQNLFIHLIGPKQPEFKFNQHQLSFDQLINHQNQKYFIDSLQSQHQQTQFLYQIDQIKKNGNNLKSKTTIQDSRQTPNTYHHQFQINHKTNIPSFDTFNFNTSKSSPQKNSFLFDNSSHNLDSFPNFLSQATLKNKQISQLHRISKKPYDPKQPLKTRQKKLSDQYQTDSFLIKKRKLVIKCEQQKKPQKKISQKIKKNTNELIKTQINKQQQPTFSQLIKKQFDLNQNINDNILNSSNIKQSKKQIYYSKQQYLQFNLHQLIQQNYFKCDKQQQQIKQQYSIINQQEKKNQKKKKKRKKKNKTPLYNQQHLTQQFSKFYCNQKQSYNHHMTNLSNQFNTSSISHQIIQYHHSSIINNQLNSLDLVKQLTQTQFQIINFLNNMKIDLDHRSQCYKIDQDNLNAMIKRQQDILSQIDSTRNKPLNTNQSTKSKKKKKS